MNKRKLLNVVVAVGAGLLMATGSCFAQEKELSQPPPSEGAGAMHRGGKGDPEKMMWKEEERLGLSDEQRIKMKAWHEENRVEMKKVSAELKVKQAALRQELDADAPDRAKAESLVKGIAEIELQMGMKRIDQVFKVREILTPEQAKKMRSFHEKKMKGMNDKKMKGMNDKKGKKGKTRFEKKEAK